MRKRNRVLIAGLILCFILTTLGFAKQAKSTKNDLYKEIELFAGAISIIRSDYVDEVNSKDLIYGALGGLLGSLDSNSQFMEPDEYSEMKVETEGKFGGLGIEITIRDNVLTIISAIEGSPAAKAGLMANDRIVKINNESTKKNTLTEAVKKLRGEPGTDISLTILREDEKKLLDFKITRAIIEIKSIKESSLLQDKIGYIRLVEFQENTPKELAKNLQVLKSKGMDSLILDLRGNPGGLLDVSVNTAEMFLPQGKVVVFTKGRVKNQNVVYKSNYKKPYLDFPLVVLVNGGSASASEIVAGAIKDNKRGVIIGTKTFGKGSVQTVIPLPDGSALRLTTAKYLTPNGQTIDKEGITPDVIVAKSKLPKPAPKPKPIDEQLERAVDLIKGIKAYEALKS